MSNPNLLITGGCSYSEIPNKDDTWPLHLQCQPYIKYVGHTAHGASGNGLISRKVISRVLEAIDLGHKTEDMLVAVMWSGCDRMNHYSEDLESNYEKITNIGYGEPDYNNFLLEISQGQRQPSIINIEKPNEWVPDPWQNRMNPLSIRNHTKPTHYIFNSHWHDELTTHYYEKFVNPNKALIETCEHILRTQWFLQSKGIKYFFSEYDHDVFHYLGPWEHGLRRSKNKNDIFNPGSEVRAAPHSDDANLQSYLETSNPYSRDSECLVYGEEYTREDAIQHIINPEINYLYDQIDRDYFLPVKHLQDWVTTVSSHEHARDHDPHPSTEQHIDFVQQVILPFILEKYDIQ